MNTSELARVSKRTNQCSSNSCGSATRDARKMRCLLQTFAALLALFAVAFAATVFFLVAGEQEQASITVSEYLQQPVAPNDPVFTFDLNSTVEFVEANYSARKKRADDNSYEDFGSGDEGEIAPSGRSSITKVDDNEFVEKKTVEEGLILANGPRDKREEDCKNEQQIEKISDNLEKVKADVEKISAHIFGAQLIKKSSSKQTDGKTRLPICFFQPDPASLSGQMEGNYFSGQVSGSDTNPVTCVFVTPAEAPSAEKFEGKILVPVAHGARQNGGGISTDGNGAIVETTTIARGLPLPERSRTPSAPEAAVDSFRAAASRKGRCKDGHISCRNGECIMITKWCDGKVDCSDASDEAICRCRRRVDPVRLCDDYMDCPNGEDEDGCNGCIAGIEFGCKIGRDKTQICLPLEMRCDGVEDCPTGSDEKNCAVLLDGLSNSTQVEMESHISGFLHINHRGTWFPLCNADAKAALEACKAEVGADAVDPQHISIQMQPVSAASRNVLLFSTDNDGCKTRSVAAVRCPLPKCGSRILDAPHHASRPITKRVAGGRIVGGKLSSPSSWPYLVAIFRDGHFHCGGSLILEDWILSAAHCVHDYTKHFYEVQAGMLRRLSFSPQEQTMTVTHVIVHRDYNRQVMTNDLSLLKIAPAVRMSKWARHVCLPPPGVMLPEPGTTCITVGWGATKEHGSDPDQIHEVDVPILNTCKHVEDRRGIEICAGLREGGKDACQGDSGGPLLCQIPHEPERWYVAGVVSHGEGCARPDEPGAYTRVGIFLDWIHYHTSDVRHLPKKVPLAKCPSIECSRVGGRCLATSMVCDKIVDCLNAVDEINCKSFTSRASFNSSSRFDDENPPIADGDRVDVYSKYMNDTKVMKALKTLKEAKLLSNATGGLLMPKFYFSKIKSGDRKVNRALRDLNETGLADEVNLLNVTKFLEGRDRLKEPEIKPVELAAANNSTGETGSPSASESTLEPLNSADPTNAPEAENKLGEIDLPATNSPSTSTSSETPPSTAAAIANTSPATVSIPPPTPESKGGDLDLSLPPNATDSSESKLIAPPSEDDSFYCDYHQAVPRERRCDQVRDCEDGRDEQDCTCRDYLMSINPLLLCNGEIDCRDHSDERGCSVCDEDEYLCPLSRQCVKQYQICDRKIDCTHYEDEIFCFALVKGPQVMVDQDNHPLLRREGYLSYRKGKQWYFECITDQKVETVAADICSNLGFSYYKNAYTMTVSNEPLAEVPEREYYRHDYNVLKENTPQCTALYIECGERLHTKPKEIEPCGDSSWSWYAAIYKEGKYLCSGTLISKQWVLTSTYCAHSVDLLVHYLGVLLGSHRLPGLEAPYEQTRRVVSINDVVDSDASLLRLDRPVQMSRQVIPLTLPNNYDMPDNFYQCMAMGPMGINGSVVSVQFVPVECDEYPQSICLQRVCAIPDHHDCEHNPQPWSGAVACQSYNGNWYPMAVFDEPLGACGFKSPVVYLKIIAHIAKLQYAMGYPLPPVKEPPCTGLRCPLGRCVLQPHICDGLAECRDRSDEPPECEHIKDKMICLQPGNVHSCVCGANGLPCGDGTCVPKHSFCDGKIDCGTRVDEPEDCKLCGSYLRIVDPSKICDGNRNCMDKSDEAWSVCGCREGYFRCYATGHCIPPSFECDGEADCPDGEDEHNCVAVRTQRSNIAVGDILRNTCGLWHEYCPPSGVNVSSLHVDSTHLCRQMGFASSTAAHTEQQVATSLMPQPDLDVFFTVQINEHTQIVVRYADKPLAQLKMAKCPSIVVVDCSDEKHD